MAEETQQTEQSQQVEQEGAHPAAPKARKRSSWLRGCGIGCAGVLLLALLLCVGVYLWGMAKMRTAQTNMAAILNAEYPKWKANGVIPPESAPVFDNLVTWAGEEGATTWKTSLCFYAVGVACEDGVIDEREAQHANLIHQFLTEHPKCTMSEAGTFFWTSPNIQEGVMELKDKYSTSQQGN